MRKSAFSGVHVLVKSLPIPLQRALAELKYNRRDIEVAKATTYDMMGAGGDGYRSFCAIVDLKTGRNQVHWGSWGGSNMFNPTNPVDTDSQRYPLSSGTGVIKGTVGGGKPVYAYLLLHPDDMESIVQPSTGGSVELTPEEKKALSIIGGYISSARRDMFRMEGLGGYSPTNPLIVSLAKKGLIKVTGTGIQVTLEGRNMRNRLAVQRVASRFMTKQAFASRGLGLCGRCHSETPSC